MDAKQIDDLRRLSVKKIIEHFPALDRAALVTLQATEAEDANPRDSLIEAIAKEIYARDDADEQPLDEATTDEAPDWQRVDYDGPITADQAQWRIQNLPRHWETVETKPAAEVSVK